MYETVFVRNMVAVIKPSQIDCLTPSYDDGRLFATLRGNPVCVLECPVDQDYKTVLDSCIKDLVEVANDPDRADKLWSSIDWYREWLRVRTLRGY